MQRSSLRVPGNALAVVVLAWLALALLPQKPLPPGTGVDASWIYGLNMAHARGLVTGVDVVYTMGPLGYLMYPDPDCAPAGAVLALLAGAYALFLYGVLRCVRLAGFQTGALVGFVLGVLSLYWLQYPDVWQAACLGVLLAAAIPRERFPALDFAVAGAAAGFTLLFKFNDGVTLCALFYVLLAWQWFRSKRHVLVLVMATLPPLVLQAGMAAHGDFFATLPYIRNTMEVARGYSEAMSFAGPAWQAILAAASAVFIVTGLWVFGERPRTVMPGLIAAALLSVTAFKHGMVRQDGHADVTQSKLAIAALFVVLFASRPRTRRIYAGFAVLSSIAAIVVCHMDPIQFTRRVDRRATLQMVAPSLHDLASWSAAWKELGRENREMLGKLRLEPEFHQAIGSGAVDAFPSNIETVRANGWTYQPRPVIQSFVAYTPELDRLNAAHIAGPHAADFVVLQPGSVDGRNLFFDDPLSWRALVDRYELRLTGHNALLLSKRSAGPRFQEPERFGATLAGWREEIPVPRVRPDEALMMKVDIRRTLLGKLKVALFRGAPVQLQASRDNGPQSFARMVRANLMSGVFISPLPGDLSELAAWFGGFEGSDPVARIYWWTPGPAEFEKQIRIEWFRVRTSLR